MRLKRIITAIAVAALLFSLILNLSLPAMALSDNLDYGRESSGEEESLTPSELLEKIIDTEISDVERKYLDKHSKVVLKYDSGITSSYVKSDYVAANGELTVRARPYSYTAENGATVTWLPTVITLDGREGTQRFEGDECISVFGGVTEDDNTRAEVTYKASFTVGKDTVNSLLNMAYNDAVFGREDIARRNAEYDRLYAQYREEKLAYEDYLERLSQYESDYALYTKYLQDKRIYEELCAEYEEYLALLDDFNEKNEVYLAYLEAEENYKKQYTEYLAYKRACEEYEVNKPLYEQYLVDIEVARAQLKVIDAIKVKMTDGRTVYDAVMGSTVTSVLENKDLITSNIMGAREDVVDLAGNATEKLRELFRDYFSLKTEEQKYNYYVNNYESFKTSFRELLVALDNLYRVRMVRATLISEGKDKKYIILVSQLYIIATALSEEEITSYDGKYKYNDSFTIENQTPKNILEKKTYFEKVSPVPLKSGYPTEIKEPKLPEVELTEPKKPTPIEKPTAPDYVQKPDEPKEV
ncbi:MAG: hypothetical protein IIX96_04510, partial [Clostridia bacterium]|nr:hypothetical protein [Clostridia bacterium]